ncbi:MAG: hypothetical protein HYW90_04835 [Candidatus Sungbacteria bacterium]|nr:hypothetical protein [Parcubacteria group bacterium]MBI2640180.1 hypothetical protein [Candidatus Sungbacteria bacterium]
MIKTEQKIPVIRGQTLEHIARHFGELTAGWRIELLLKDWGVPETLINRSGSKWWTVNEVLKHYAYSTEKKDHEMLFKIIGEILHPIMYGGNKKAAETAAEDFNKYLEYDNLAVGYDEKEKKYEVCKIRKMRKEDIEQLENEDLFIQEQEELAFLRLPENKEKISTLRKAYQVFMNIAEVFCDNTSKPSHDLNDAYVQTKKLITDAVRDLHLYVSSVNGAQRIHTLTHYFIPFNNLFTAEKEYTPDNFEIDLSGKKLSWDYIRPRMNATYGGIDELYRRVEGSDVLSKSDVQQTLNDVSLLLSKTKEENIKIAEIKQKMPVPQPPVQKIEITAMPEVPVRFVGETPGAKNRQKRESPIEVLLPEPCQWEKVTLKIKEGRQEVDILYNNGHIITADYRQLRFFVGKKQQKPDRQWGFLCALAMLAATDIKQATTENMRRMITQGKMLSANNVQQVKKSFVEQLQNIFKTHDDPFQDNRTYYEPKFAILPEPSLRRENLWPQGGRLNENRGNETDHLAYEEKRIQEDNEEEAL